MKFLIISSLLFGGALGFKSNHGSHKEEHSSGCVDISMYGPVGYNKNVSNLCNYKMTTNCKTSTQEVCEDIIITDCKIVGYTECHETETEDEVSNDIVHQNNYFEKICTVSPHKRWLTEIKQMPVCQNVTKKQCDSKWVINALGEKVFDDHVNCKDVTWENCKLVPTPIEEEVETYDCVDAEDPITYETVEKRQDWVSLKKKTCKAVGKPVCEVSTKTVCEDVEIHNCQDAILPNCFPVEFNVPYQEYNHLLRCPIKH